jgi:hypothetical protein
MTSWIENLGFHTKHSLSFWYFEKEIQMELELQRHILPLNKVMEKEEGRKKAEQEGTNKAGKGHLAEEGGMLVKEIIEEEEEEREGLPQMYATIVDNLGTGGGSAQTFSATNVEEPDIYLMNVMEQGMRHTIWRECQLWKRMGARVKVCSIRIKTFCIWRMSCIKS